MLNLMEKIGITILSVILAFVIAGCAPAEVVSPLLRDSNDIAFEVFEKVILAIEEKDKEGLKNLFSKQAIADSDNLDEEINSLFEFYKGKMNSNYAWGEVGTGEKDENGRWKWIQPSYDIETTEEEYKILFKYYLFDTSNEDNVGIYSLYIIKAEDFFNVEFEPETSRFNMAYGGDIEKSPGITIEDVKTYTERCERIESIRSKLLS